MAKRFVNTAVNWSFIMETLPTREQIKVGPLRMTFDKYMREVTTKPSEIPQIDWMLYKNKLPASVVDSFQKSYEALKIPYPSDQGLLAKTESSNDSIIKFAEETNKKLLALIEEFKEKLQKLEAVMKYSEMTMEEFYLARPDLKIDPDKPRFWPHLLIEKEFGKGASLTNPNLQKRFQY